MTRQRSTTILASLFFLLPLLALALSAPIATVAGANLGVDAPAQSIPGLEVFVPSGEIVDPTDIAHAGDGRLFVTERAGVIRVVEADGDVRQIPFMDIGDRVRDNFTEQGLLGLVFHPDYSNNGYFYVNYTAEPDGTTHISRFSVTGNANVADPTSEQVVLSVAQPYVNHNAGDLLFGPEDGYLYIPLGDGGSADDPTNNAQTMSRLLGKMLRVDVDGEAPGAPDCGGPNAVYTIPAGNPFVDGSGGACDEIWSLGLRNPWRTSFDALSGDLYIGDVGQGAWEEIDVQPASSGGQNWGWSCFEGTHENPNSHEPDCQPASAYDMPVFEYDHALGCAVTGGFVYRGDDYPLLYGQYLLTDYCTGYLWALDTGDGWASIRYDHLQAALGGVTTFGEDVNGELYAANRNDGAIYRFVWAGEEIFLSLLQKP